MIKDSISVKDALYTDLYFTLSTSISEKKQLIDSISSIISIPQPQHPFFGFVKRALKVFSKEKNANTINHCDIINDFIKQAESGKLNLLTAQKIYTLSLELKRHYSTYNEIWNSLPSVNQLFFNRLTYWFENPTILQKPIVFQWLGHGQLDYAKQDVETITDFGGGALFHVQPPTQQNEVHVDFALTQHTDFKVMKPSPYQHQKSHAELFTMCRRIDKAAIGRLNEVFDIETLEEGMRKDGDEAILSMNQFFDCYGCYRSALCDILGIHVNLPLAIGTRGEWAIVKKNTEKLSASNSGDLYQLFHIERMWNINVLPAEGLIQPFSAKDDCFSLHEILPLPTFCLENLEEKHERTWNMLKKGAPFLDEWNERERLHGAKEEKVKEELKWLETTIARKNFTLNDFVTFEPQAMLFVRLIRSLELGCITLYPTTASSVLEKARQLVMFFDEKISTHHSYTYQEALESKGMTYTEQLIQLKKELKLSMIVSVVETFEKKNCEKECIEHLMHTFEKQCQEIDSSLNEKESSHAHPEEEQDRFMIPFGKEFMEEMELLLHKPLSEEENLYDKLLLLRKSLEIPKANLQVLNETLLSVLHEAMLKKNSQRFLTNIISIMEKLSIDHQPN